jgi:hypothetical protein
MFTSSVVDPDSLNSDLDTDPVFQCIRIRIRIDDQKLKNTAEKFLIKYCHSLITRPPLRTFKLQEKPSALKREQSADSALSKKKIINFFLYYTDPGTPTEFGSNPDAGKDPDLKH